MTPKWLNLNNVLGYWNKNPDLCFHFNNPKHCSNSIAMEYRLGLDLGIGLSLSLRLGLGLSLGLDLGLDLSLSLRKA
jgi:hypothetical protein